ncbi:chromate efflux transporter [Magnetospirillum sulfuroxidans]|uniref:Chromate efflux transporter n=1 Tax=Magnetospirillum sulfuroxidans TaxID=611300 RepID=A0ABS5I971_9PROT|nr:chromate efflux transporter [Magnetospirillum sulfuroxidans]MBR9970982.1 chromate efflux transporter [Magnetospirillum sulfuroxidans]
MRPDFPETVRAFLRIGLLSFGGPAGQIATMHRILVDEKRWLDEPRFLHALNFCMLLPGPEAQQLVTYAGWLLHGVKGGLVAGLLFVLPGFVVMLGLAALYAGFTHVDFVQGLFLGLKPAVLAVVVQAGLRIGARALKDMWARGLALASFVAIFAVGLPFPLIVLAAGLAGWWRGRDGIVARGAPAKVTTGTMGAMGTMGTVSLWLALWLAPVGLAWIHGHGAFAVIGLFFAKLAVVTFGGAYAALSYVAQQAVESHGWLSAGEMLDGLGLAETTPGPLVLVNQFVGFLAGYRQPGDFNPWLGGVLGASLTVWVTFVPSFLWIFAGAPHVERLRGHAALSSALAAITAAVVGVIFNLALWFALHVAFSRFDGFWPMWRTVQPLSLVLAVAAMIAILRFKWGMVPVLTVCAAVGAGARQLGWA